MSDPAVSYPAWYLQRWHFLPEGYLSRRSVRLYDTIIRNVYNAASESRLRLAIARRVANAAPRSVLDVGCGPGWLLRALFHALPGTTLHGLDLSPFMLETARERLARAPGVTLLHGDCLRLPAGEHAFDAVTAIHVFGHLPPDLRSGAIEESVRVLRPGGRLFVLDHAWHTLRAGNLEAPVSQPLLGGLLTFRVFEKA
jgi:ubiquinone/menaquinone biosynthesis C-methylase UbiE